MNSFTLVFFRVSSILLLLLNTFIAAFHHESWEINEGLVASQLEKQSCVDVSSVSEIKTEIVRLTYLMNYANE